MFSVLKRVVDVDALPSARILKCYLSLLLFLTLEQGLLKATFLLFLDVSLLQTPDPTYLLLLNSSYMPVNY